MNNSRLANKKDDKTTKFPSLKTRPFLLSDLKSVPKRWRIGGPNYIGVGTPKAGTTWWYSLLLKHPQIVNNRLNQKELRYFVHFGYKGLKNDDISTYYQAFAAPENCICGEWSPIYLSYPFCAKYMAEVSPSTKILAILRNPVDGVISYLNEATYGVSSFQFNPDQHYVFSHFNIFPRAMISGSYAAGLHRFLKYFDKSKFLVLQYEKCKRDPLIELKRTYRFLGVDENFLPKTFSQPINRKKYIVEKLNPQERMRLAEYFRDDVNLTIKIFPEIDLSLWKDFKNI